MKIYYYSSTTPSADYFEGPYNGEVRDAQGNVTQRGTANVVRTDNGETIAYLWEPLPADRYYEATPDNTPILPYYFETPESPTLSFSGTEGSPAARVVETKVTQQIPIADLYDIKRQEIFEQDVSVRYNAVDTSLSANWWLIITREQTTELLVIAAGSNSRQIDSAPWPGGANAPWVGIYNANTIDSRRYQITAQATWDTLETEWYQHLQSTGNATDASRTALDAAYDGGAGNWQAVADHDAASPAWGYPPTVDPDQLRSVAQ